MPDETQQSIGEWGEQTFGYAPVPHIAARVVNEASELVRVATKGFHLEDFTPEQIAAMADEAADVAIFLMRLAHLCNFDIDDAIDRKMAVNRSRKWVETADGRHVKVTSPTIDGGVLDDVIADMQRCIQMCAPAAVGEDPHRFVHGVRLLLTDAVEALEDLRPDTSPGSDTKGCRTVVTKNGTVGKVHGNPNPSPKSQKPSKR